MASAVGSAKPRLGKRRRASARAARGMSKVCSTQPRPAMGLPEFKGLPTPRSPFRLRWRPPRSEPRRDHWDEHVVLTEEDTTGLSTEGGLYRRGISYANVHLALSIRSCKDAGGVVGPAARCWIWHLCAGLLALIVIGIVGAIRRCKSQLTAAPRTATPGIFC